MKVVIDEPKELGNAVNLINRIITTKLADSDKYMIIEAADPNRLVVGTAYEGKTVLVDVPGVRVDKTGEICLPYTVFSNFAKTVSKSKSVSLHRSKSRVIDFKAGRSSGTLTLVSSNEIDAIKAEMLTADDVGASPVELNPDDIDVIVRYMLFDTFGFSDTKPAVKLGYIDQKDSYVFMSSDPFSGAVYVTDTEYPPEAKGLEIPGSAMHILSNMKLANHSNLKLAVGAKHVALSSDRMVAIVPLEETGTIMDSSVFLNRQAKPKCAFTINSSELTDMVRTVTMLAELGRVAPVKITLTPRKLLLSSQSLYGRSKSEADSQALSNVYIDKTANGGRKKCSFVVYNKVLLDFVTSFKEQDLQFELYDGYVVQRNPNLNVVYIYAVVDEDKANG